MAVAGRIPPPPMVRLLGLRLVEVDHGRVAFTGAAGPEYYNGMGVAHGCGETTGRVNSCRRSPAPPLMSPPT